MNDLMLIPSLHPLAIALLALAPLTALALLFRRRAVDATLLALRLAAVALFATLLLDPSTLAPFPDEQRRPGLAILVDRSISMCLTDADGGAARFDEVADTWLHPDSLYTLGERARVNLIAFDETSRAATLASITADPPDGAESRLLAALNQSLAAAPPESNLTDILLLTDAVDTDNPTPADLDRIAARARARGIAIHAAVPGAADPPADIALTAAAADAVVQEGESTTLRIGVSQRRFTDQPALLTIRDAATGGVIHREHLALQPRAQLDIPITPAHDPAAGEVSVAEYIASIAPLPGEADDSNNTARAFIQVASGPIRALLLEDQPAWETKFLIAALRADPGVDLTTILGLAADRELITRYRPEGALIEEQRLAAHPVTARSLADYDLLILGRGVERWFTPDRAELLRDLVISRGGSVIFLRADPIADRDDPSNARLVEVIDELAPVEWAERTLDPARLAPTPQARREQLIAFSAAHPAAPLLSELPAMRAATQVEREKALAVVWLRRTPQWLDPEWAAANESGPAALATLAIGRGRTVALLTEGLWQWAFLPTSLREYDSVYRILWSRIARWLVFGGDLLPGQSLALTADPVTAQTGEPVHITLRPRYFESDDLQLNLTVRAPSGESHPLTLARADETSPAFHATFTPREPGVHHVEAAAQLDPSIDPIRAATRFAAAERRIELLDTAPRRDDMRRLTSATGGNILPLNDITPLLNILESRIAAAESRREPQSRWNTPWVFAALIGLLGAEWFLRRWRGHA
ncbi:MAG: hypothetical protein VYC34_04545 [Planctomycetota bacterium]|nr:hypothetical protein [Planctomycetota bacterium]